MGYGYALLPVADNPVSDTTFRLTPSEKRERDEWIMGAVDRKFDVSEIAYEVGLSVQRVKQIIKANRPTSKKSSHSGRRKFNTPKEAAIYVFETEEMHPGCAKNNDFYGICSDCFGMLSIIESEYDENGWPYSWAMLGQERYIAMTRGRQ